MRLSEIFDKPSPDLRWTEVVQSLIDKHGLQKFVGLQATVITTPDRDHVYRIWTKDAGFERWMEYALQHQDNPHIVKVLGRPRTVEATFKGLPKDVKVKFVKLEKLIPITNRKLMDGIDTASNVMMHSHDLAKMNFADFIEKILEEDDLDEVLEKYGSFFETTFEVTKDIRANDIMAANVMMRGDIPVIVDPLSEN